MSEPTADFTGPEALTPAQQEAFNGAVWAFEKAWGQAVGTDGPRPDPGAFLPADPALRRALALELALIDLEWRLTRDGDTSARAEGYIARFPMAPLSDADVRLLREHEERLLREHEERRRIAHVLRAELRFTILTEHEVGGMGRVFLARDEVLRRLVAIKTVNDRGPRAELDLRFLREIEITATLDHPGVIPIHAQGDYPDGRKFSWRPPVGARDGVICEE